MTEKLLTNIVKEYGITKIILDYKEKIEEYQNKLNVETNYYATKYYLDLFEKRTTGENYIDKFLYKKIKNKKIIHKQKFENCQKLRYFLSKYYKMYRKNLLNISTKICFDKEQYYYCLCITIYTKNIKHKFIVKTVQYDVSELLMVNTIVTYH